MTKTVPADLAKARFVEQLHNHGSSTYEVVHITPSTLTLRATMPTGIEPPDDFQPDPIPWTVERPADKKEAIAFDVWADDDGVFTTYAGGTPLIPAELTPEGLPLSRRTHQE